MCAYLKEKKKASLLGILDRVSSQDIGENSKGNALFFSFKFLTM